jgi:hypothetical protein
MVYQAWKYQLVNTDDSKWNVCSKCFSKLEPYLKKRKTQWKKKTVELKSSDRKLINRSVWTAKKLKRQGKISKIHPSVIPSLTKDLRSQENGHIRRKAAKILGIIGNKKAVKALKNYGMDARFYSEKRTAKNALEKMEGENAEQAAKQIQIPTMAGWIFKLTLKSLFIWLPPILLLISLLSLTYLYGWVLLGIGVLLEGIFFYWEYKDNWYVFKRIKWKLTGKTGLEKKNESDWRTKIT